MSEKKAKYEEKKAIVTEYEGVKFVAILPDVEISTEVEAGIVKLGAGGKRQVRRKVIATVVDDPRLPTAGPVPQSVWVAYWKRFYNQEPKYKKYIAEAVTDACGVAVRIDDVEVSGSIPVSTARWIVQGKDEKEQ